MLPWLIIGLATIVAAILSYRLLKLIIRRPSLHLPPGPRPWPVVGNLPHIGPLLHRALAVLARTYGPLMYLRLGFVDVVVAASASVAEQFLKVHDANFSSRPLNSMTTYMTYNQKDLAFAPYGPRWRFLRKISSVHMFSVKALDDFRQLWQVTIISIYLDFPSLLQDFLVSHTHICFFPISQWLLFFVFFLWNYC